MVEGQAGGVEELPLQPELAGPAIGRVSRDRQLDRLQVHADLVRPPRLKRDLEECMAREKLRDLEMRHCLAWSVRVERVALGVVAVAADRRVDRPLARARTADDERE